MKNKQKSSDKVHLEPLQQYSVVRSFVNIRLNRKDIEDMISTYEFLAWQNEGDERKFCNKILRKLKQSLL